MNINDGLDALKKAISFKKNLKYYIPIAKFLFLAICGIVIFELAANFFSDYSSNNNFSESYTVDDDGAIIISDEELDKFIEEFEGLGIGGFEALGLTDILNLNTEEEIQKAKRAYLKNFFEAQAVTETINYGLEEDPDKTYGTVYVYRTKEGATTTNITENPDNVYKMTYLSYEEWTAKKEVCEASTDTSTYDITDYFSLNDEGKLVYAGWSNTVVIEDGVEISNETRINEISVNYKNVLANYKTTVNYFLYLVLATQNPEFAIGLADEVKDSQIHITIMDSHVDSVEDVTNSYTDNKLVISKYLAPPSSTETPSLTPTQNYTYGSEVQQTPYSTTTTTKIKSQTPTIDITYAKVWFATQELDYNQTQTDIDNIQATDPENEEAISFATSELESAYYLQFSSDYTWKTNIVTTIKTLSTSTKFSEGTKYEVDYEVGYEKYRELLDTEYEIISTGRKEKAGDMLKVGSNANLLFHYLEKDSELQRLEEITRYFLYRYTGVNYGVTELNGELLGFGALKTVSGSGGWDLLKRWIRSFENSEANAYTDDTKTQYKIHKDTKGYLTVGYGVLIYQEVNGEIKVNRKDDIIARCAAIGETVTFTEGLGISVEVIDEMEEELLEGFYNTVKNTAQNAGITLTEYQIHALTSRCYNYGNVSSFPTNYFKYWSDELQAETDKIFEEQDMSKVSNKNTVSDISFYENYFNGGDNSDNRRLHEWILYSTGYYNFTTSPNQPDNQWYSAGGSIIDAAAMVSEHMANNGFIYNQSRTSTTFEQVKSYPNKYTDCSHYVSIVLQEAGYLDLGVIMTSDDYYIAMMDTSDTRFVEVSHSEMQAGDLLWTEGHIEIYAGGDQKYNAGYQPHIDEPGTVNYSMQPGERVIRVSK